MKKTRLQEKMSGLKHEFLNGLQNVPIKSNDYNIQINPVDECKYNESFCHS